MRGCRGRGRGGSGRAGATPGRGPRHRRPRGAADAGPRRCLPRRRYSLFRPIRRRRRAGGQQDLHQTGGRRGRRADRRLGALHGRRCRADACAPGRRPHRGQGRWAGSGQGCGRRRHRGRGGGRHRRLHGGPCAWRGRRRRGDRGMSHRRGDQLLRLVRRHHGSPVRRGAGPQARLRRRSGAEHRRHGRVRPSARLHACPGSGGDGPHHPALPGRDGGARHAVLRRAVRRAHADRAGAEADRVQCAFR